MFPTKKLVFASLILGLVFTINVVGQQSSEPARVQEAGSQRPAENNLKTKLLDIKHADPNRILSILQSLTSRGTGANVTVEPLLRVLTVRDFPENIAVIEDALKRLDKPEPPRSDIEFRVHVLIATTGGASSNQYPANLNDVIKQLQSTFSYKNYNLMTSTLMRTKEGSREVSNKGVAERKLAGDNNMPGSPLFYNLYAQSITVDRNSAGAVTVQVGSFGFDIKVPVNVGSAIQYENIGFKTPVSVREGEQVIVGTTSMEDKGLVIVLSAKVMK